MSILLHTLWILKIAVVNFAAGWLLGVATICYVSQCFISFLTSYIVLQVNIALVGLYFNVVRYCPTSF